MPSCTLVYIATIGGLVAVPKPLVLPVSMTALPEKNVPLPASCAGPVTGMFFQCTRSVLVAPCHVPKLNR